MQRSILVTTVRHKETGKTMEIYGRYDAVKLAKEYDIIGVKKGLFKMTDDVFASKAELVRWLDD